MDQKQAIQLTKKFLQLLKSENEEIIGAYLFGSYAKDNFSDDSDIDLAIILKSLKNRYEKQVNLMISGSKLDSRIEPHPFNEKDFDSSNPFANEIINTGIKIL